MITLPMHTNAADLAADILAGRELPSAAMGRGDIYDALNAGASGALPFLGTSSKIDAGSVVGILSKVLYMMPARSSGREACSGRSAGCTDACLVRDTGRMNMSGPVRARARRHASFYADRARFLADLHAEIGAHERAARRAGKVPAVRLNGTTDLPWHRMSVTSHAGASFASLHTAYPEVRFYEYTKLPLAKQSGRAGIPANLSLTFSISERADADAYASEYLQAGYGAAVVLATAKHALPSTFPVAGARYPVADGDAHDARFLDPAGSVVGLAAKGRAKRDLSGFVRELDGSARVA